MYSMCVPGQGVAGEKASDAWTAVSELSGVGVLCRFAKRAFTVVRTVVCSSCGIRMKWLVQWTKAGQVRCVVVESFHGVSIRG